MASQERRVTLGMLGDWGLLVLPGNPALRGLLARGVLQAPWVEKAEKGRRVPRGSQVLTGPQGGQAHWGLEDPLGTWGRRAFEGSQALWVSQASWDLLGRWALLAPWGPLASRA